MSPALAFIKMHGCGNDYVFLDCFDQSPPSDPGSRALVVSDRHRGIGADGLVLMLPPDRTEVAARMRMFNVDGSEGALCGNALRCMAMWLYQSGKTGTEFQIAMGDRRVCCEVLQSDAVQKNAIVRVKLGQPVVQNPVAAGRLAFVRPVALEGLCLPELIASIVHVSMGNPHTVLFVRSLCEINVARLGPLIETHHLFPDRTNVEFVEIEEHLGADGRVETARRVNLRVWERGSGETLACGSGACAVAVAGISCGLLDHLETVWVSMRGGELGVRWAEDDGVSLEGPTVEVFRGHFYTPDDRAGTSVQKWSENS